MTCGLLAAASRSSGGRLARAAQRARPGARGVRRAWPRLAAVASARCRSRGRDRAGACGPRAALEQQRALGHHQVDVQAERHLDAASCRQPAIGSPHASTRNCQAPSEVTGPRRRTGPGRGPARAWSPAVRAAVGVPQHHPGPQQLVAFAEHRGADLEGLAPRRPWPVAALLGGGLHVEDGDSAYHAATLPTSHSQGRLARHVSRSSAWRDVPACLGVIQQWSPRSH